MGGIPISGNLKGRGIPPSQRPRGEIESPPSASTVRMEDAIANIAAMATDPSRHGRYYSEPRGNWFDMGGPFPGSSTTTQPAPSSTPAPSFSPEAARLTPAPSLTNQNTAAAAAAAQQAALAALLNAGPQPTQKEIRIFQNRAAPAVNPGLGAGLGLGAVANSDLYALLNAGPQPTETELKLAAMQQNIAEDAAGFGNAYVPDADEVQAILDKYTPPVDPPPAGEDDPVVVIPPGGDDDPVVVIPPGGDDDPVVVDDGGGGGGGVGGGGGGYFGGTAPFVDPYASALNLADYRRPADLEQDIRDLMAERTTQDFSQQIRNMIAERQSNLTASEARRMGQISDIERQLGIDIGALETDRLAQQQALIDAVTGRTSDLTTGIQDRLTTAREALGPQVTDEFEQVAQLVGGLGGSQAASSQDAMSRLAQVANMAAAERGAAPGQLAAESKLALGDEAFRMFQGLDQEQTQRLMDESMRQEDFNTRRDEDMVNALLGDVGRREDFLTRETERQQQMDYGRGERIEGQQFQTGERIGAQDWRTNERLASQLYGTGEREAGQIYQTGERALDRTAQQDAATMAYARSQAAAKTAFERSSGERALDRAAQLDAATMAYARSQAAATKAFERSQQQISEAQTYEEKVRLAQQAAETSANTAISQGSASAAAHFMGIKDADGNPTAEGAALWDALPEAAKTQMYKDKVAAEDTQGARWQPGTYANMIGKYGEENSDHILHAEHMVGMSDEKQKAYLASLSEMDRMDRMGKQAMDANDIQKINLFLAEMQAAFAAQQASNLVQANLIAAEHAKESGWSDEFTARLAGAEAAALAAKAGAYSQDSFLPKPRTSAGAASSTPGFGPNVNYSEIGPGGY